MTSRRPVVPSRFVGDLPVLTTMEKRYIKVSIFLLPFVLYTAVMLKMLDKACQTEIFTKHATPPDAFPRVLEQSHNSTTLLHSVLRKYEAIDRQRTKLSEMLNKLLSGESPEALASNDLAVRYFNARNLRDLKGFDKIGSKIKKQTIAKAKYVFNCTNVHEIKLIKKVGHGVSKQAFLGKFKGQPVAVKMVTRHQKEVRQCLEGIREKGMESDNFQRSRCFVFPTMKLMKEILLLEQLDHPGFVQLLGYCVRSEESDSTDMSEHGVVAIYEYGERFVLDNLQFLPMKAKLLRAVNLAKFLQYLEFSPLGSLRIKDFKEGHFLLVNSSLKMIDLDDVDNIEPSCDIYSDIDHITENNNIHYRTCEYDIQCQMGLCIGYNAKQNLKSMNRLFFKRLLYPLSYPSDIVESLTQVNTRLETLSITAPELVEVLESSLSHL
ncbi:extracellular tyrosine-protein kinase PKDCC-like [Mizuhopecten yessoensis]|uniref:Protein kinase domain-containing protein, cytoplasmic n=1 Tax=Mizuhopecten yessoensis TaxID=6573 RepID=A0A210PRW3_MIZYE|nr:extracellular tyrosine-protein kinase PKDCC-like [Mizuhopecten yessoensis]OWF39218.1 Protein kinase domain-containing protein, cytoplasmic [Mizuhopecten yessoensis]